jgi:hypothetical protein
MTEIITQSLDIIHREFILVNQDGVMSWTRSALQPRMRKQEEIVELRMDNVVIDDGAGGTIPCAVGIATFSGEETCVVTFCNDDKGDVGTVPFFEGFTGRTDGFDFRVDDVGKLAFGDSVAEEENTLRFGFGLLVECLVFNVRWDEIGP